MPQNTLYPRFNNSRLLERYKQNHDYMKVKIAKSWLTFLTDEINSPYSIELANFIKYEYSNHQICPDAINIFRAFDLCDFDTTKVIIIGQDPYPNPKQATGLCFSVNENINIPPSLINIFKEVRNDVSGIFPKHGNLERWAKQGVLLLNSILTVRSHHPNSHQNKGWEKFTDAVIKILSREKRNLVFMLWGTHAQKKGIYIDKANHLVLNSSHPSPFSAHISFFGCNHFSKANNYLILKGSKPIEWRSYE